MQNDENESPVRESGAPGAACGRDRSLTPVPIRFGRAVVSIDSNDRSDSIRTRRANSQTHCLEHSRRVGASREDRSAPPAPARDTTVDLNESAPRVGPNDGYVSGVFDAGEVSTISTTYPYDFHDDFHFAFDISDF